MELDRERTYLAALLALSERHYVILHASSPEQIEATFPSEHEAPRAQTRWLVTVNPDASLAIDMPPSWREMQRNTEGRYLKLVHSVDEFRCRDPNWLRWEAQNRGLVPIGALALGPEAAGGEAPPDPARDSQLDRRAMDERLDALLRERANLHLGAPITWSAAGVVTTSVGLTVLFQGAGLFAQGCTDDPYDDLVADITEPDCSNVAAGRALMITGGVLTPVGGVLLAVALPRMFRRLAQVRAVNAEIQRLRNARLSVGAGASAWGATLRVPF